jgi:hypothetical protein
VREKAVVVGDPGVPLMAALLAVPVGVLLFVVMLALLGRRWTVAPAAHAEPYFEQYVEPYLEPHASAERYAEPAPPPYPPRHAEPRSPWQGGHDGDSWGRPEPEPWPAPARELSAPRPRAALPPARPALPPAQPAYGSYAREEYGPPPERASEQPQGFPYGPYRHQ